MPSKAHPTWGIIKPHKPMIVEHNESQSQTMALRPKLAGSVGARPERAGVRHASAPPDSLWGAVSSMEGLPPALGPRTALRDSQRLEPNTASYTKEKRAEARRFAEQGRQMRGELKELEAWFVDHGHLDKDWRDQFK